MQKANLYKGWKEMVETIKQGENKFAKNDRILM